MNKTYFKNIQNEIAIRLEKAHTSVQLAVSWFTDSILFDKLIELLKDGIEVKVIVVDDEINRGYIKYFIDLIDNGGEVFFFPTTSLLMHHKFCIIDSSILLTGSYNWTSKAANSNSENLLVLTGLNASIKQFQQEFETLLLKAESYHIRKTGWVYRRTLLKSL